MHRSSKLQNDCFFALTFLVCELSMLCQDQLHNVKHKTALLLQKNTEYQEIAKQCTLYSHGQKFTLQVAFPFHLDQFIYQSSDQSKDLSTVQSTDQSAH